MEAARPSMLRCTAKVPEGLPASASPISARRYRGRWVFAPFRAARVQDPARHPLAHPAGGAEPPPPHPVPAASLQPRFFKVAWPKSLQSKLEPATIERVLEADVLPAVYDQALWKRHRSRYRLLEHLSTMVTSYFLRDLAGPLLGITAVATAVALYETGLEVGVLPSKLPNIALAAPEVFSQSSFALSLMLVFRTNTSYARYAEARVLWGSLVNRCRNIVRQAQMLLPANGPKARVLAPLCRWAAALPVVMKVHLREEGDVAAELKDLLLPAEVALLVGSKHRPLAVLAIMSQLVGAAGLDPFSASRLDINLEVMENILGGCERILRTPIPLSYTRHTARFLALWLLFLPFTLWEKLHWGVVPASALLSYLLLGIDQIAIQLEEPFGILPLEAISNTVHYNIEELTASYNLVKQVADPSMHPPHLEPALSPVRAASSSGAAAGAASNTQGPTAAPDTPTLLVYGGPVPCVEVPLRPATSAAAADSESPAWLQGQVNSTSSMDANDVGHGWPTSPDAMRNWHSTLDEFC